MSFNNYFGKDKRKPYRGGKAIDPSCRNHGGCPWCEGNRLYNDKKHRESANEQLKEYRMKEANINDFLSGE